MWFLASPINLSLPSGDAEDNICVFGQGNSELARLALLRSDEAVVEEKRGEAAAEGTGQRAAVGVESHTAQGDAEDMEADPTCTSAGTGKAVQPGSAAVPGDWGAGLQLCEAIGLWGLWIRVEGAHEADVNCVRWNPAEPRLLASCGDDGMVKLWWLRP